MRVIDVDSHFHEPLDWLQKANPELASQIPPLTDLELFLDITIGDLFAKLPEGSRPSPLTLAPPALRNWIEKKAAFRWNDQSILDAMRDLELTMLPHYVGEERIKWLEQKGIDIQVVSPTVSYFAYRSARHSGDPRLPFRVMETYNSWATDQFSGMTDRLIPSMLLDLSDIEWSMREMQRMRMRGSRVALISADPVQNKSLTHPDFEPIWASAADLNITILFHVGGGRPAIHPGWGNNGGDASQFTRLSRLIRRQLPELALGALALSGVFERYPKLGVLTSELGIEWVPSFLERLDDVVFKPSEAALVSAPYRLPLKPSEYIRRQVRISVVPEYDTLGPTIGRLPTGLIVFASDFPHPEGSDDAVNLYSEQLLNASQQEREAFFGAAAAEIMHL